MFYLFWVAILLWYIWKTIKNKETYGVPFSISLIIGFCFLFVINTLLGPLACKSGWRSPSIGSRGACSYHGGVEDRSWVFFLFIIVVLISWSYISEKFNKRSAIKEQKEQENFEKVIQGKITNKVPINDSREKDFLLNYVIKNNLSVSFDYIDNYGNMSSRTVSSIKVNNNLLTGYCHLKRAERNFRICKATNMKVNDTSM